METTMTDSVAQVVPPETLTPDTGLEVTNEVSKSEIETPAQTPPAETEAGTPAPATETQEPTPRTMQDINREYQQCCLHAGEAQYQLGVIAEGLERTNLRLRQLNNEAAKLQAKAAAADAANKANTAKQAEENLKKAEAKRLAKAAA